MHIECMSDFDSDFAVLKCPSECWICQMISRGTYPMPHSKEGSPIVASVNCTNDPSQTL